MLYQLALFFYYQDHILYSIRVRMDLPLANSMCPFQVKSESSILLIIHYTKGNVYSSVQTNDFWPNFRHLFELLGMKNQTDFNIHNGITHHLVLLANNCGLIIMFLLSASMCNKEYN
jgi:hypothetical protein